jgi:hypothetical protein
MAAVFGRLEIQVFGMQQHVQQQHVRRLRILEQAAHLRIEILHGHIALGQRDDQRLVADPHHPRRAAGRTDRRTNQTFRVGRLRRLRIDRSHRFGPRHGRGNREREQRARQQRSHRARQPIGNHHVEPGKRGDPRPETG